MAYPVAIDFSSVKTLIAFAERAQKHSLVIPDDLQIFIDEPGEMALLVKYVKSRIPIYWIQALPDIDWVLVYRKFGMEAEYREFIKTINWNDQNLWVVPAIKGVTCNKVIRAMRNDGVKLWLCAEDLDAKLSHSDRDPANGSYVVGFRRNIEADEENKDLSANALSKLGRKGITLLERLILEAGYFWTTKQYLDVKNVTLATGSCFLDGFVPSVDLNPDDCGVCVDRYDPGNHYDNLRSRFASFPPVAKKLA